VAAGVASAASAFRSKAICRSFGAEKFGARLSPLDSQRTAEAVAGTTQTAETHARGGRAHGGNVTYQKKRFMG
jgi:hypothetical protein